MVLMGVYQSQMGMLIGQLGWRTKAGDHGTYMMVLDQKAGMHSRFKLADQTYQYKEIFEAPVVGAQVRYNPSIPLIINALFLSVAGLLLLIRQPQERKIRPKDRSATA